MKERMVVADSTALYQLKEGWIIIVALVWFLAVGGLVVAGRILCGSRGATGVSMNWLRGTATISCR